MVDIPTRFISRIDCLKRVLEYRNIIYTVLVNVYDGNHIPDSSAYDIAKDIVEVMNFTHKCCIAVQSNTSWYMGEALDHILQIVNQLNDILKKYCHQNDYIGKLKYNLSNEIKNYILENVTILTEDNEKINYYY